MAGVMGGEKTPTAPTASPRRGALAPLFMVSTSAPAPTAPASRGSPQCDPLWQKGRVAWSS